MVMCVRCEDVDLSDHISYETLERFLLQGKGKAKWLYTEK